MVGGGDSAVKEALYLANMVREVVLIHRRDQLRADKVLADKVFATPNIKICWDTVIDEIIGEDKIKALKTHNIKSQQTKDIDVDGVFMYVGSQPNTEFLGEDKHYLYQVKYELTDLVNVVDKYYSRGGIESIILKRLVTGNSIKSMEDILGQVC